MTPDPAFWAGKRVLLTGHTGFKGSWAALWLTRLGARVTGLALAPEGEAHHFGLAGVASRVDHHLCDLRDAAATRGVVAAARPDLVLHMAAQALVRRSLRDPVGTWASNVQGTAHLLDALRAEAPEAAVLVVTSDKVYANDNSGRAFREDDPLGGKDPYSASKAGAEILCASWRSSFGARLATVRGGNVIGGGDFSEDRIVPDIVRAAVSGRVLELRHPEATRPWQHVLDCLNGYLLFLQRLATGEAPTTLNIGPDPGHPVTVAEAAAVVGSLLGLAHPWRHVPVPGSVEALALGLDPTRAKQVLGWHDRLAGRAALEWTADWYRAWAEGAAIAPVSEAQIARFTEG